MMSAFGDGQMVGQQYLRKQPAATHSAVAAMRFHVEGVSHVRVQCHSCRRSLRRRD
jgi:hypothetical protein